jgi:hypothetical protein
MQHEHVIENARALLAYARTGRLDAERGHP